MVTDPVPAADAAPAAIAAAIYEQVTGPTMDGEVVGVHRAAIIISCPAVPVNNRDVEAADVTTPTIVAVVAADGSGVPNAIRIAEYAAAAPFAGITVGDPARIGAGLVQVGGLRLRAARRINTRVPHCDIATGPLQQMADAARAAARGVADGPVDTFRTALAAHLVSATATGSGPATGGAAGLGQAVRGLIGLGTGSTPGGDDVLAGTLSGLYAAGASATATKLGALIAPQLAARTSAYSAALLRLAIAGHICTEVGAVLRAAHRASSGQSSDAELEAALTALLRIGHTSGADLTTGLAIGLAAAATCAISAPSGQKQEPGDVIPHFRLPTHHPHTLAS